ncbi:MAG: hypothetical protein HY316_07520 [Acidobacteria bacterium]|nr:hypothetical protein [Acidobacteriota bacterium]
MKVFGKYILFLALALGCSITSYAQSADKPVTLVLEERTTIHVGDFAELQIPPDSRYSKFSGYTVGGNVLAFVSRSERTVLYRAVQVGKGVIVMSPDVPEGECISCATRHYFITVVPQE